MTMDKILNETTEWTPEQERAAQRPPAQGVEQRPVTDGGQPTRTTVQAQTIQIPTKKLEFWIQVAQLAILVLIMLRQ